MPGEFLNLVEPGIHQNIEIGQSPKKESPSHPPPTEFAAKNEFSDNAAQGSLGNGIHGGKIVRLFDLSAPDHFIMSIRTPTTIMRIPKILVSC